MKYTERRTRIGSRTGFTLVELLVVVLILGILAAAGVPAYLKSVETTKAGDAVILMNKIGMANRMFAADHSNIYIGTGGNGVTFPTTANTGCGPGACSNTTYTSACNLVWCKYLTDEDFGSKPYTMWACDPGAGACSATGWGSGIAAAERRGGTYNGWGYLQSRSGVITNHGGAPTADY